VHTLKQLNYGIGADFLDLLRALTSIEVINETIIGTIMFSIVEDCDVFVFFEVMEKLCEGIASKNLIAALRNG